MINGTQEEWDKFQSELKQQVEAKMIEDIRKQYPLTVGEYLRQHFPDDAENILKRECIPADYAIFETRDVFFHNSIQCARILSSGETISYCYLIHPRLPLVEWFLYPKEDPNPSGDDSFSQG